MQKVESFLEANPPEMHYKPRVSAQPSYPKEKLNYAESFSTTGYTTNPSPLRAATSSSFVDNNTQPGGFRRTRKQRIEDSLRRSNLIS